MKIRNPKANAMRARILSATNKTALRAAIDALESSKAAITFDELRELLPAGKRKVPDGELHQWALDEGFEVEVEP